MNYFLFVKPQCAACDRVRKEIEHRGFSITILDKSEAKGNLCGKISIVPALFKDESLMAYGDDIISWLDGKI